MHLRPCALYSDWTPANKYCFHTHIIPWKDSASTPPQLCLQRFLLSLAPYQISMDHLLNHAADSIVCLIATTTSLTIIHVRRWKNKWPLRRRSPHCWRAREAASAHRCATFRRAIGNVRPGYWLISRILSGYLSLGLEICGATTNLVRRKVTSHG